jgi:hypothetical protein
MSEDDKGKEQNPPNPPQGNEKAKELHVTVDSEQMRQMAEDLAREKADAKAAKERAEKAEAEKKAAEEAAIKSKEEAEDAKGKLGLIAEKELEKKRTAVKEKANTLFQGDAERIKDIEARLKDPEGVQAMEYTLNVLDQTLKKGEEARKKFAEEEKAKLEAKQKADAEAIAAGKVPEGSAPLNDKQLGQSSTSDLMKMKFDSHEAMVRYLKELEHGPDPEQAAKATVILNEFFAKWAQLVKQNYDTMRGSDPKIQPTFKELTRSKRAQEELRRRNEGKPAERIA